MNNSLKYYFLFVIIATAQLPVFAQSQLPLKDRFHFYVCLGQSNMKGYAQIEVQDTALTGVYLLNGKNQWEAPLRNGIDRYSNLYAPDDKARLSPGYSFARKLAKNNPSITIGILSNCRGATAIEQFMKGDSQGCYDSTLKRIRAAQQFATLKGFLWHQGENNSTETGYAQKLVTLVRDLRRDLNNDSLVFLAGELSPMFERAAFFNAQLAEFPKLLGKTAVISSAGLTGDLHFDSKSVRILGERYADTVLSMVYKSTTKSKANSNWQKRNFSDSYLTLSIPRISFNITAYRGEQNTYYSLTGRKDMFFKKHIDKSCSSNSYFGK